MFLWPWTSYHGHRPESFCHWYPSLCFLFQIKTIKKINTELVVKALLASVIDACVSVHVKNQVYSKCMCCVICSHVEAAALWFCEKSRDKIWQLRDIINLSVTTPIKLSTKFTENTIYGKNLMKQKKTEKIIRRTFMLEHDFVHKTCWDLIKKGKPRSVYRTWILYPVTKGTCCCCREISKILIQ